MANAKDINTIAEFVSFAEELKEEPVTVQEAYRKRIAPVVEAAMQLAKKLSWEEINEAFEKRYSSDLSPEGEAAVFMLWYAKHQLENPEMFT